MLYFFINTCIKIVKTNIAFYYTMVDLRGGQDGPIEHGFSNSVFILPGIIFISLSSKLIQLYFNYLLFIIITVFFGYKLYKSLVERERRKEEKRRQKQQKKKK